MKIELEDLELLKMLLRIETRLEEIEKKLARPNIHYVPVAPDPLVPYLNPHRPRVSPADFPVPLPWINDRYGGIYVSDSPNFLENKVTCNCD